jgi:hypothetical protein
MGPMGVRRGGVEGTYGERKIEAQRWSEQMHLQRPYI